MDPTLQKDVMGFEAKDGKKGRYQKCSLRDRMWDNDLFEKYDLPKKVFSYEGRKIFVALSKGLHLKKLKNFYF